MSRFCFRCKTAIGNLERKVTIIDDDGKETFGKKFFHKDCWHDLMTSKKGQSDLIDMTKNLIQKVNNKFGDEETVVEI